MLRDTNDQTNRTYFDYCRQKSFISQGAEINENRWEESWGVTQEKGLLAQIFHSTSMMYLHRTDEGLGRAVKQTDLPQQKMIR